MLFVGPTGALTTSAYKMNVLLRTHRPIRSIRPKMGEKHDQGRMRAYIGISSDANQGLGLEEHSAHL